jgi:hypothetical protein
LFNNKYFGLSGMKNSNMTCIILNTIGKPNKQKYYLCNIFRKHFLLKA